MNDLNKIKQEVLQEQETPEGAYYNKEEVNELIEESVDKFIEKLNLPVVTQRSEQLKGDYRQHFLDWKNKYFTCKPTMYEYVNSSNEKYTIKDLHKRYERAMLQSPFNCG